ncbi:MAG: glycosyltransferase family 4 protein [Deltaproteobacteria bacterium]|nr:MAG: glycosyltransferase family 4 protein [Deltaproteobacteria bacterium]
MKIFFLYQGVKCHGRTPEEKPLGGTESAMIFMAKALAKRNHDVHVFTNTDSTEIYDHVTYHPAEDFETQALKSNIDVLIGIRQMLPLLSRRWARLQLYLSPDAYDQPALHSAMNVRIEATSQSFDVGLFSLNYVRKYIDGIICVGEWQAQTFTEKFNIPPEHIFVGSNGVDLDFFPAPSNLKDRKKQIVYASTPFRGLDILLKVFPKIKQKVPDASCAILSGMQTYGISDDQDQKEYGDLYIRAQQPGVTLYGPLAKRELVKILEESRLMTYPNTFAETFCIAALEAQAAGLPVVTTDLAGLKERVSDGIDGFLISGHASETLYQEKFIEYVTTLLTDDSLWEKQSHAAYQKALSFSYDTLAERWENYFEEKLTESHPSYFFLPHHDEKLSILVGGYPKQIELKKEFLCRSYAKCLYDTGYHETAKQVIHVLEG